MEIGRFANKAVTTHTYAMNKFNNEQEYKRIDNIVVYQPIQLLKDYNETTISLLCSFNEDSTLENNINSSSFGSTSIIQDKTGKLIPTVRYFSNIVYALEEKYPIKDRKEKLAIIIDLLFSELTDGRNELIFDLKHSISSFSVDEIIGMISEKANVLFYKYKSTNNSLMTFIHATKK